MPTCRVLIVDDQRDVRRVLRAALETLGRPIQITDVPSGEEAILVISRQPVDVMIADVRLPGISGLELVERARVRNPELSLVLITGMTDEKVRRQVELAQADAFFYKPIEIKDFLDTMRTLLQIDDVAGPLSAPPIRPPLAPLPRDTQPVRAERTYPKPAAKEQLPAEMKTPEQYIQGCTAALRRKLKAELAVLMNLSREFLTQDGPLPVGNADWTAALEAAAGFAASPGAGQKGILLIPGETYDFLILQVTPQALLLAGTAHSAWDQAGFGGLADALWTTAGDIRAAGLSAGRIPTGKTGPLSAALEDEGLLPDLDALFEKMQGAGPSGADVDAFWDHAAEDHSARSGRPNGLTFDQARQLGLAPEDD